MDKRPSKVQRAKAPERGRGGYRGARGGAPFRGGFGRAPARGGRVPAAAAQNNKKKGNLQKKKNIGLAHITSLLTENKSFSLRRLMKDYDEIKKSDYNLISCAPLEDNFYSWRANIKLEDPKNKLITGIMHLSIDFTEEFPIEPPTVKLAKMDAYPGTPYQYLFLNKIGDKSKKWNPDYTVMGILLKIQDSLLKIIKDQTERDYGDYSYYKQKIQALNEYTSPDCPHKGIKNPWPQFKESNWKNRVLTYDEYQEEKSKEFKCYFSKTNFDETPLGVGISVKKKPRTGEISGVVPRMDYISLKAFTKQKIRTDIEGEKFTHWFPIYFGNKEEQFFHLAKKAISLIKTGSTKNFSPDMIFSVLPKFFLSLITEINSENVTNSKKSLKILCQIYRIVVFFGEKYPEVYQKFEEAIKNFIENPVQRNKDNTPSLGDLLIYSIISKKYNFEEILPAYMGEQMDRSIFWILQTIPEFEKLIESNTIDDVRAKICFKTFITGAHILLFCFYFAKKVIFKGVKNNEEISKLLDENHGSIPFEHLNSHETQIQKILKIDNFQDYYKFLNLPVLEDAQINDKIKQAFKNSEEKGYHGFDAHRFVPDSITQMTKYFEKFPKLQELIENGNLRKEDDPLWRNLVMEKFELVEMIRYQNPARNLTPGFILENYERMRHENLFTTVPENHTIYENKPLDNLDEYEFNFKPDSEKILENFSFRKIYLKLYLEMLLKHFDNIADFKLLYDFLEKASSEIVHLNIDISTRTNLKSDYNYLRVAIGKLNKLEYLNLNLLKKNKTQTTDEGKITKNLIKGLNNFKTAGGKLLHLKLYHNSLDNLTETERKVSSIYNIVEKLPDLKSLDLSNNKLNNLAVTKIRNHFYYFKSITTLILSNCQLDDKLLNELSDGMMKAKGIENIFLNDNLQIKNLAGIVNNLAFQPSLKILNIGGNTNIIDTTNVANALTKLLKMSQSIEILICSNIRDFNRYNTLEFYQALGDNTSLKYLDLTKSGVPNFKNLGISVAMNALKKGSLEVLKLEDVSKRSANLDLKGLTDFIQSLSISEELHNKWYGSNINMEIVKDSKEYYEKTFYNNLKYLHLGKFWLHTTININHVYNKTENEIKNLFENSKHLTKINLNGCNTNQLFMNLLSNALQNKNNIKILSMQECENCDYYPKFLLNAFYIKKDKGDYVKNENNILEKMDLSKNDFGYSGIEILSKILKENKSLRSLNLYKNLFDVNGARRLAESLLQNKTLEILDIGYNRIRDLGFKNIMNSLINNKENNLKQISFRCNFIRSNTIMNILPELNKVNTKLTKCNLSNNLVDENTSNKIFENLYSANNSQKSLINSDIFSICYLNKPERLERCAWITTVSKTVPKTTILQAFEKKEEELKKEENSHFGVILSMKLFKGRRYLEGDVKGVTEGNRVFVEFVDPNSVNRLLKIVSVEGFMIDGNKVKCFKAGAKKEVVLPKKKFNK